MKVKDIYGFLDETAPFSTQDSYDNAGLLVGDPEAEVKRALIVLDITHDAVFEALARDCQLIITHHPVIFNPLKSIIEGSVHYRLVKSGISVISAHTNLDMAKDGVSDMMLELLGFDGSEIFEVKGFRDGEEYGYGKICTLSSPCTAKELAKKAKDAFGTACVRYVDGKKPVLRVAVCSGSGGSLIDLAVSKNCDGYITGDLKHDHFISAENSGLTVIDAGHFYTEAIFAKFLSEKLLKRFPEAEFIVGESNRDVVNYL